MPEGEVLRGGEEAGGVGAGFLEGGGVEPGCEVGEDGVAGGVEGVGVGWGRVADGGDEEGADGGHVGDFFLVVVYIDDDRVIGMFQLWFLCYDAGLCVWV